MPEKAKKTLLDFLKEEAKSSSSGIRKEKNKLKKYILTGSKFYKDYFPDQKHQEIYEDIVKIIKDKDKELNKADIITRDRIDKTVYRKYTLVQSKGKRLISDMVLQCRICKGKGCERCKDGWVK